MSNTYKSKDYIAIRAEIDRLLKKSHVTDEIHLTRESNSEIIDIWDFNRQTEFPDGKLTSDVLSSIPADLLIMNTLPIYDCRFRVDGWDSNVTEGLPADFRVCVFDESDRIVIDFPDTPKFSIVGSLEVSNGLEMHAGKFSTSESDKHIRKSSFPFILQDGCSTIKVFGDVSRFESDYGYMTDLAKFSESLSSKFLVDFIKPYYPLFQQCLSTWYGTQICMLYPPIREQLSAPRIVTESDVRKTSGKTRKQPLRYVKVHTINAEDLKRLKCGNDTTRSYERKTMVWHVCGHHRTLKSGETIWVHPYDKGPGKDLLISENRQRIIMTEGAKGQKRSLRNNALPDAEVKAKSANNNKKKNQPSKKKMKQRNKANKNHASL